MSSVPSREAPGALQSALLAFCLSFGPRLPVPLPATHTLETVGFPCRVPSLASRSHTAAGQGFPGVSPRRTRWPSTHALRLVSTVRLRTVSQKRRYSLPAFRNQGLEHHVRISGLLCRDAAALPGERLLPLLGTRWPFCPSPPLPNSEAGHCTYPVFLLSWACTALCMTCLSP